MALDWYSRPQSPSALFLIPRAQKKQGALNDPKRAVYLGGVVYIRDAVHLKCGLHSIVVCSLPRSERFFFGYSGFPLFPKTNT